MTQFAIACGDDGSEEAGVLGAESEDAAAPSSSDLGGDAAVPGTGTNDTSPAQSTGGSTASPDAAIEPSDASAAAPNRPSTVDAGGDAAGTEGSGTSVHPDADAALDSGIGEGSTQGIADAEAVPDAEIDASAPACEGTWALGDGNLFIVIDEACVVLNFCDIVNVIHTTGSLVGSTMTLDSVAGEPLSFTYELTESTLTMVDGWNDTDLPLTRIAPNELPIECFVP